MPGVSSEEFGVYHFLTLKSCYHKCRITVKSVFPANSSGMAVRAARLDRGAPRTATSDFQLTPLRCYGA